MMNPGRYEWTTVEIEHEVSAGNLIYNNLKAFVIYDKENGETHFIDTSKITTYAELMDHNRSIIDECDFLNRADKDDELYLKEVIDYTFPHGRLTRHLIKKWKSELPF